MARLGELLVARICNTPIQLLSFYPTGCAPCPIKSLAVALTAGW